MAIELFVGGVLLFLGVQILVITLFLRTLKLILDQLRHLTSSFDSIVVEIERIKEKARSRKVADVSKEFYRRKAIFEWAFKRLENVVAKGIYKAFKK